MIKQCYYLQTDPTLLHTFNLDQLLDKKATQMDGASNIVKFNNVFKQTQKKEWGFVYKRNILIKESEYLTFREEQNLR
jgi:hypothetical protein